MDRSVDACWFSVLSCPCANQLGPSWLAQFDLFFLPSQPLDFPKKQCWDVFLDPPDCIDTTPSHPPTLAYSFSHLPSHLCISNDLVSPHLPTCPPIYLPSGTHISAYLPIYPYTPINVLHITQAWGNVDECRCRTCNPCGVVKWWNPMKILHFIM
jgi:hypothetical protein